MAKNKKPRKKYKEKPCRITIFTQEEKAEIARLIDTAETTVRLSFKAGYATPYHLDNVRHIMNAAIVCMEDQDWHVDPLKCAKLDFIYDERGRHVQRRSAAQRRQKREIYLHWAGLAESRGRFPYVQRLH